MALSSQFSGCASDCGDKIEAGRVYSINTTAHSDNPKVQKALDYIRRNDPSKIAIGKHVIDDDIALSISDSALKDPVDAKLEAHKKFIDLQFPITAEETMGLKNTSDCKSVKNPYDPARDIEFFNDAPTQFVTLKPGEFIVLPPNSAHAPCIGKGKVLKGVFKIKVD